MNANKENINIESLYHLILGRNATIKELDLIGGLESNDGFADILASIYRSEEYNCSPQRFLTTVIDISNKCNLRCRMCYFSRDDFFYVKPSYMRPEMFADIAEQILPHTCTLTLSCGSEPLCSPYFIDILKITSRYNLPNLDFCTNGMLLSKKRADAVIEYNVTDIMFSVDAANKRSYEDIRRGASFNRLINNIEYLVNKKETTGKSLPGIRFNMTLMKSNIAQVEDLINLAANLGVSMLDLRHLVVYDGLGMDKESLVNYKKLANYWLDRARQKAAEKGLNLVACPENFSTNEQSIQKQINRHRARRFLNFPFKFLKIIQPAPKQPPNLYCTLPFTYTLVNAGGGVFPCPHCHGLQPLGLLTKDSLIKIWLGKDSLKLRRSIIENNPPEMCRKCPSVGKGSVNNKNSFDSISNLA